MKPILQSHCCVQPLARLWCGCTRGRRLATSTTCGLLGMFSSVATWSPSRSFALGCPSSIARVRRSSPLLLPRAMGGGSGHHYRPFTADDEAQLTSVLTTKPRHVARHIRQSMLHSRRRIAQFRNAVTYLMILLQSQLQRKQITPADATPILESIMRECVELRQGDMAHLLFRASIRFRKYGLQVGYPLVRHLFDSYRLDNARDLLRNLADELRTDPQLRFVATLAYQLGGDNAQAMAVLKELDPSLLGTEEYCSLLECFGATAGYAEVVRMTEELLAREVELRGRGVQLDPILSTAIVCLRGDAALMEAMAERAIARGARLSDAAAGVLLRSALSNTRRVRTLADAYDVERELRERLGTTSLGVSAETALIAKCSELMVRGHEQGDEVMLAKVERLRTMVEGALADEQADELDPMVALALIKGYGVLGRFEDMRACFDRVRDAGVIRDHRLYDEMLKWYAFAHNVKEVIALKEEMTRNNVFHTAYTYHNVFRVLDKYYPRMVEKYLAEMRAKGMAIEGFMYPTLLRVFTELQDTKMVEHLYREIKSRAAQGNTSALAAGSVTQMLRCYQDDAERCESVLRDAAQFGLLSNESVQAEIATLYASQDRRDDLDRFLSRIPHKSASLYRALLRDAARRRDRPTFQRLLGEVEASSVALNERLFSTIVAGLATFHDGDGVRAWVARAAAVESVTRSPFFFADSASAYARLGDPRAADACWEDLLASSVAITMPVYNRFLELFMAQNNMARVQEVLDTMMQRVPPNPVTATTVVDMLGKMGRLTEMEAVLAEMSRSTNAAPTLVTYHQVMNAYAKCGDVTRMEDARARMVAAGFKENHVTFNILFDGYGRAKRFEHLQELVAERQRLGIAMDEHGYVALLNYYSRARLSSETEALVEDMVTSGVHFTSRLLASIATAFSLVGNVEQMEHYVGLLLAHPECRLRDVEAVYLIRARMRDPVRLQELLDNRSLPTSEFIYNVCVGAFARAGEHNKVAFLLVRMEELGYTLSRNTSVTLSSLLLKAGKLELAQTVLRWSGGQPGSGSGETAERPRDAITAAAQAELEESHAAPDTLPEDDDVIQEQLQAEVAKLHGLHGKTLTDEDAL